MAKQFNYKTVSNYRALLVLIIGYTKIYKIYHFTISIIVLSNLTRGFSKDSNNAIQSYIRDFSKNACPCINKGILKNSI